MTTLLPTDELQDALPLGWRRTSVGEIFVEIKNGTTATQNRDGLGLPVTRIESIQKARIELSRLGYISDYRNEIDRGFGYEIGDILFSHINSLEHVGKTAIYQGSPSPLIHGMNLLRLRTNDGVVPEFFYWQMQAEDFRSAVRQRVNAAVNQVSINQKTLRTIPLVTCPKDEQFKLAAKIQQLVSELHIARDRLATIPALLKKFRQSVLSAACSGQLTADWRTSIDPSESGLELLGRLTKTINKAPIVFQGKDIPESWVECTLDSILPKGDIFDGPFGSSLKSSDYTESGVRVIRLENIGVLEFRPDKHTYISVLKHEALKRHSVFQGDIIFSSFISDELRVCVLPPIGRAIAKADCFCLRPFKQLNRQYIALQLSSQFTYDELIECVHGATRPRVNTGQLRSVRFRLAPMAEQVEIVRRVASLFAIADSIESRLAEATSQVEITTQAILAKAFRGEL